jgi:hypothetical protein
LFLASDPQLEGLPGRPTAVERVLCSVLPVPPTWANVDSDR